MKFVASLALVVASTVSAQAQPSLSGQLDTLMDAYVANTFFSGVVVVADRDSTLYQRAVGLADRERNVPIAMTSRFNIASVGKTFTAVLIMQLVEEGRLDLHSPIHAYLSDRIPNADRITIHHLLTHTSGLSNYMTHPDYQHVRNTLRSLTDVMKLVSDMGPVFTSPGERFEYSNSGYIVLGRIIEQVTGRDYLTYVKEKLWQPLGMTSTSIAHPAIIRPPTEAIPYYVFSKQSSVSAISDENPAFSDGGAFSNALDLLTFARALLSKKLLKQQTMDLMFSPHSIMSPAWRYGYGWSVSASHFGKRVVGHSGGGLGYSNDMRILLDDGKIVIVQANLRTSPRRITEGIIKLLATGTMDLPKPSPADVLFAEIEKHGVHAVLDNLQDVLARRGLPLLETASTLIDVADALQALRRDDEALQVHQKNALLFPNSPMPFNAMGEMYLRSGNRDAALASFKRAHEIDPNDAYALMRVEQLK